MATDPILVMRVIDKRFPGVHALDRVDFDVRPGEVHGLMGENGAGKSTLIKVLGGVYLRDGGTVRLAGRPFNPTSPAHAQHEGISTVHQEVNLIPTLSVAENLFLGRTRGRHAAPIDRLRRWWGIDWREQRRRRRGIVQSRFFFELSLEARNLVVR